MVKFWRVPVKISLEVPEGSGAEVSVGSGADTWVPVQIPGFRCRYL